MKKIALIAFLLAACAAAGRAQESRQDISLSGTVLIGAVYWLINGRSCPRHPCLWRTAELPFHAHALKRY